MYKFFLHNQELSPPQNEVMKALENMTTDDLSHCKTLETNITTNTTTINSSSLCTDASGNGKVNTTKTVQEAPFIVKTCDQVLYIQGAKKLKDYDDCNSREEGFFTMSMYMVNYFKKKESSTLKKSILIEDMDSIPEYVMGTKKKCLDFKDGRTPGSFAICFEDPAVTATLYSSFLNFMKCRMGDNLRPLSIPQLKKVYYLTCHGLPIDPKVIFSNDKDYLIDTIKKNFKKNKINPYYSYDTPGSDALSRILMDADEEEDENHQRLNELFKN
eukprot:CAMPEP_0170516822 /NCGR_PEP_ID=MMETSP0209-20121228/2956_1 /TAXON_ID=665100 ORGANISM="Litonotus pictus, Strain P1" /NCGR_SAMPLE_ID=MMETSP0209 /ASSEMBLY_ACC=CAM_ASM_000301 /LENGTH=271 /DNA_ID=CAMNT_0010801865 /DNA_START=128 /DNA_END=943 /DNA_ORIENTATION=+